MAGKIKKIPFSFASLIRFGLYWWLFLLPWQARWIIVPRKLGGGFWEYGSVSLYGTEIMLAAIFFVFIIWRLRQKKLAALFLLIYHDFVRRRMTLSKAVLAVFLWSLLTVAWSPDPLLSLIQSIRLGMAIGAFALMRFVGLRWARVVAVIIAAGVVQSWLAVNQFVEQYIFASKWLGIAGQLPSVYGTSVVEGASVRWLRAYGSFPHPNILGGFLAVVLFFVLERCIVLYTMRNMVRKTQFVWHQRALWGAGVLAVSGILLSFSRAAWLASAALLAMVGLYVLLKHKSALAPFAKILIVAIITSAVWIVLYPEPFQVRVRGTMPLEQQSLSERRISYEDSQSVIARFWLGGIGIGAYTSALAQDNPLRRGQLLQPVHNSWLLIVSELGVVGLVLMVVVWIQAWLASWRAWRAAILLLLVGLLMMFDHWWFSLALGKYFMLTLLASSTLIHKDINDNI